MKITLSLDDDLYDTLKAQAKRKNKDGVEEEIMDRLERFAQVPSGDRAICIWGDDRRALEAIFQFTIDDPADLIARVKRLCAVKIGPCERALTAGELVTLRMQAGFFGLEPEAFFKTTADKVIDETLGRI